MRRSLTTRGWILVLALAGSGSAFAADDTALITAAGRAFSAAYVSGDTTALGDLYTADAVLLPPGGEVRGRAAIRRWFAPRGSRTNLEHALEVEDLRVFGDTAVDVGTWRNVWRIGDGEPQEASGRYLVVWRREADEVWRMAYDMWHRPVD